MVTTDTSIMRSPWVKFLIAVAVLIPVSWLMASDTLVGTQRLLRLNGASNSKIDCSNQNYTAQVKEEQDVQHTEQDNQERVSALEDSPPPIHIGLAPQVPDDEYFKDMCTREYGGGGRGHQLVHLIKYQTRALLILDIGGHEGRTTFPPMLCLPIHHRVITVEPIVENQHLILNYSKRLGVTEPSYQWRLIRAAFSNITGRVDIYVPRHRTDNTALNSAGATAHVGGESEKVNIPVFRGDDLIHSQNEFPDFIKIDVQGSELTVMEGLKETLSQPRNMVVIAEFDPGLTGFYGIRREEPMAFMTNLGFKSYCNPEVFVHEGIIYVKNETAALSIEQLINEQEPPGCEDIVYFKNIYPNPGPPQPE